MNSDKVPSVNELAKNLVTEIINKAEVLGVKIEKLSNGAMVLNFKDANADGAIYLSKVCMGDLCTINQSTVKARINASSGTVELEMLEVETLSPIISCMGSQYAGWNVKVKKINENGKKKTYFKCMGSGPARAIARGETELYEKICYKDNFNAAIIVLETSQAPDEGVAEYIAKKCKIDVANVYLLYAPTACLTGSIQIAARIVETSIHKFLEIGLNPKWLVSGQGNCPVAPVADDDFKAMGWTNDCIILTGNVTLQMDVSVEDEPKLIELIKKCPSNTSSSYGKPFAKIFEEAGGDFFKIDPHMFAPAKITVINRITGNIFSEGELNPEILDFS